MYYNTFIPLLSPVTIPQVVAVNNNVFSVNLPGQIKLYLFFLLLTQISLLPIPLLHIGRSPFHHESEIPLAFHGENIPALEDVPMGLGVLIGLYF
jgi:hypothetical protein